MKQWGTAGQRMLALVYSRRCVPSFHATYLPYVRVRPRIIGGTNIASTSRGQTCVNLEAVAANNSTVGATTAVVINVVKGLKYVVTYRFPTKRKENLRTMPHMLYTFAGGSKTPQAKKSGKRCNACTRGDGRSHTPLFLLLYSTCTRTGTFLTRRQTANWGKVKIRVVLSIKSEHA